MGLPGLHKQACLSLPVWLANGPRMPWGHPRRRGPQSETPKVGFPAASLILSPALPTHQDTPGLPRI